MVFKKSFKLFLKIILLTITLIFIFFPIFYGFVFSTFDINQENKINNDLIYIKDFSFKNYITAFQNGYIESLVFTFLFVMFLIIFRLIVCVSAGYLLSLKKRKLNKFLILFFLIIAAIPENTLLIGFLKMFSRNNYDNYFLNILILSAPSIFSFFTIFLFRNSFLNISEDYKRIMRLDKLSFFKKFFLIYLPKLNFSLFITIVITAASAWNSYLWPSLFLFGKKNQTLSTWMFTLGSLPDGSVSYATRIAGAYLYILPIMTIYILCNQKIIKSFKDIS